MAREPWTPNKQLPMLPARSSCLLHPAVLLAGASLVGGLAAYGTRGDMLPKHFPFPWWPVGLAAHVAVLALWTSAWMVFWRQVLGGKGGWRLALAVPLAVALASEIVQAWLPGHDPDLAGLAYSSTGVLLSFRLCRHTVSAPAPSKPD